MCGSSRVVRNPNFSRVRKFVDGQLTGNPGDWEKFSHPYIAFPQLLEDGRLQRRIQVHPELENLAQEYGLQVVTVSRIRVDEQGNPVPLPNNRGFEREGQSLVLVARSQENRDAVAKRLAERWPNLVKAELLKNGEDLEGMENILEGIPVRDELGIPTTASPQFAVWVGVPSSPEFPRFGLWANVSRATSATTTVAEEASEEPQEAEEEGIPF